MAIKILSLKKQILTFTMVLILCLALVPTTAFAATSSNPVGVAVLSNNGLYYTYILPKNVPEHNYYKEAFSSSHEFRDIFIAQCGKDKAVVYNMVAHIMLQALYDDTIDYGKEIRIIGFESLASDKVVNAAALAVHKDMPFLNTFILFGRMSSDHFKGNEYILQKYADYFSNESTNNNKTYIATRNKVIKELNKYRSAVTGVIDDEEKLEIVGKMFDADSIYDNNAPYEAISALLTKRGICGSSNWAFTLIGNAVGVPSYQLSLTYRNHAVTIVKPNGGALKIIDVTFGKRKPKVGNISEWKYYDAVRWDNNVLNFKNEYYYPAIDIIEYLGGLS